jgi:hypothetical protein
LETCSQCEICYLAKSLIFLEIEAKRHKIDKREDYTMNCPGCNNTDWEYPDVSIARCKNCGYLLDPYVFGLKSSAGSSNSRHGENSKRWAKIALIVSVLLYLVLFWIPD